MPTERQVRGRVAQRLSLIASLALALVLGAVAGTARADCPSDRTQGLQFKDGEDHAIAIVTSRGTASFAWPANTDADSALLSLTLHAQEPAAVVVRLSAANLSTEQTFAGGGDAVATLNVSSLTRLPAGSEVQVTVSNGNVASPSATLTLFRNDLSLNKSVLVLAPHPDDAEVAAFGLYAGCKSTVVTVTAGNGGDFTYCRFESDAAAHYRLKGELRVIDSVTVPWQGGVPPSRAFNLGYFDGRLQAMFAAPNTPIDEMFVGNNDVLPYRKLNPVPLLPIRSRKATWKNLVADLQAVLARVQPTSVVIPDPRLDSHPDHQRTAVAFAHALAKTKLRPRILLYTNHAAADQYPLGPTGQDIPPPPWCGPAPLLARGFYAYPLTRQLQHRKLMALESMHDLRMPPAAQYDFGPNVDPRCQTRPGAPLGENSFFRRAVRTHEVFLVTDRPGFLSLVAPFDR